MAKIPYDFIKEALFENEAGDSKLFAALYAGRVAYDHSRKEWYLWTSNYWELDQTGQVYDFITRYVAAEYLGAAAEAKRKGETIGGKPLSDLLTKRAAELRARRRVDSVLFLAARTKEIALTGNEWDSNPWLLAVENGTLDLKTGNLIKSNPADYIRAHAPVIWEGIDMPCPRWEAFQEEITGNDYAIIEFKKRLFGYAITGETTEHILPILWGEGRNGKSTELEVLGEILGQDLSVTSDADTLMDTNKAGDGPKPFIYNLRGKRFCWTKESNEGRRINAGLVKELTGGDTLTVRDMYSRPVSFKPSHTVILMTNNRPHVPADDLAIWDRIILIPYEQRYIENPQKPNEHKVDKHLKETLISESSGIIAWLVAGCLQWQRDGLKIPQSLKDATNDYKNEEDSLAEYLEENCKLGSNFSIKASELYKDYKFWAVDNGENPMSATAFGRRMKKRFNTTRSNGIHYQGIDLKKNP